MSSSSASFLASLKLSQQQDNSLEGTKKLSHKELRKLFKKNHRREKRRQEAELAKKLNASSSVESQIELKPDDSHCSRAHEEKVDSDYEKAKARWIENEKRIVENRDADLEKMRQEAQRRAADVIARRNILPLT